MHKNKERGECTFHTDSHKLGKASFEQIEIQSINWVAALKTAVLSVRVEIGVFTRYLHGWLD